MKGARRAQGSHVATGEATAQAAWPHASLPTREDAMKKLVRCLGLCAALCAVLPTGAQAPVKDSVQLTNVTQKEVEVDYSVDGGKTYGTLDKLGISTQGSDAPRPATAADVTHLRWTLKNSMAPGASGFVRFRAVML